MIQTKFSLLCSIALAVMACTPSPPNTRATLPKDTSFKTTSESNDSTQRIVSLDYCADQFVLRFVPVENIAAVSTDARKYFSYLRHAHPSVGSVRPTAEAVLALNPTKVVRSYGGGPNAVAFFKRAGIEVVQLAYPTTLDQVRQAILATSAELGYPVEGRAVVADFDQRLVSLKRQSRSAKTLYTTPGGVTTGPGSLVHELMLAAGLTNYESVAGWRDLPLERLVYEQPDQLANATFGDEQTHVDPWTRARHPHIRNLIRTTPGVSFEGAWTSCGGWFLIDAVEAMAVTPQLPESTK